MQRIIATLFATTALSLQIDTQPQFKSQLLTRATLEESLSISGSTYPCIFKFGVEIYDFTPFKLARNVWPAATDLDISTMTPDTMSYNFTWCSPMSEASTADEYECNGDYYAVGSKIYPFECEPYSGSKPDDDISASTI